MIKRRPACVLATLRRNDNFYVDFDYAEMKKAFWEDHPRDQC